MNYLKKKLAFTLSETLITLLIIGVIATMVIPQVINETNKAEYVVSLKKTYSDLQQAFKLVQAENGSSIVPVFQNDTTTNSGNGNVLNTFLTKMNYIKNCGNNTGCLYNSKRYYLGGTVANAKLDSNSSGNYEKAILTDGRMISFVIISTDCKSNQGTGPLNYSVCGAISFDINGEKGPNKIGRDFFRLWITKTGIYPQGINNDNSSCSISSNDWNSSWGCTAKVILENEMNY